MLVSEVGRARGLEKGPLMDSPCLPRVQGSSPKLARPISEVWTLTQPHTCEPASILPPEIGFNLSSSRPPFGLMFRPLATPHLLQKQSDVLVRRADGIRPLSSEPISLFCRIPPTSSDVCSPLLFKATC